MKRFLVTICLIAVLVIAGAGAFLYGIGYDPFASFSSSSRSQAADEENGIADDFSSETGDDSLQIDSVGALIQYNGEKYRYNYNLKNYLVLGIDQNQPFQDEYVPGDAGQSDFILLLSLNPDTQTGAIWQINRNLMTEIEHFDINGNVTYTDEEQITLQYAYGLGGAQSCRASVRAVSNVFNNLDIDGYLTINAAGIPDLTDAIGGVEVKMSSDYSDIDERFTEGADLLLGGEDAVKFIRERDTSEFDSATARMNRQSDFIAGLLQKLTSMSASDLYKVLTEYNETYILTDIQAEDFMTFSEYSFESDHFYSIPGETLMGETYEEYYMDEDAFEELLISNFYLKQ